MSAELIILSISTIFLLIGIFLWRRGNHFLSIGKKAEAIIYKNNFQRDNSGGGSYFPVVRFLTDKEEWITQELSIGYSSAKQEGTKIQVIYDPNNPKKVEINSSFQLEILPRIFVVLGITLLAFFLLEVLEVIDLIE